MIRTAAWRRVFEKDLDRLRLGAICHGGFPGFDDGTGVDRRGRGI